MKIIKENRIVWNAIGRCWRVFPVMAFLLAISYGVTTSTMPVHSEAPEEGACKTVTSPDGSSSKCTPDQSKPAQAEPPARIDGESVPVGTITVDGDPSDWIAAGIGELIDDPAGDFSPPGLDTLGLRVTDDGLNVYFLYEFAGTPVDTSFLHLDVDTDISTGCAGFGVGFEYGVTFLPSSIESSYIGDARDCSWGAVDFPGALISAVGDNFIEASVSIDTLKILNPSLTQFDITCSNDSCDMGRYVLGALSLTGPTPGVAGEDNTFNVSGATPGETVHFAGGPPSGSTNIPGCPGKTIDIGSPKLLGTDVADANGNASLTVAVPDGASGLTARFQAVEASSCLVSNLVDHTFP